MLHTMRKRFFASAVLAFVIICLALPLTAAAETEELDAAAVLSAGEYNPETMSEEEAA